MMAKVRPKSGTKKVHKPFSRPPDLWQPGKATPRFPLVRLDHGDTAGLSKAKVKSPTKRKSQNTRKAF